MVPSEFFSRTPYRLRRWEFRDRCPTWTPQAQRQLFGLLGVGAQYGILLTFSRKHELEADQIGLTYMARAGYDPRESVAFWKRMMAASQGEKPPEFMSTHPADQTRINQLEQLMPAALEIYQKAIQQ